jgi:hypothetical protein
LISFDSVTSNSFSKENSVSYRYFKNYFLFNSFSKRGDFGSFLEEKKLGQTVP